MRLLSILTTFDGPPASSKSYKRYKWNIAAFFVSRRLQYGISVSSNLWITSKLPSVNKNGVFSSNALDDIKRCSTTN